MKIFTKCCFILCVLLNWTNVFGQSEGEKLFKQICVACHTVNQGKLIGPDLADVHLRRTEDWLIKFVKSSQSVIKSGDPVATSLFEEYNKMVMPDNKYTDDEIRAIIVYIAENSPGGPGAASTGVVSPSPGRPISEATGENVRTGADLFVGGVRLTNRGPTCNSCHHVKNNSVMAGGSLAKDLTDVFTRLNEAGIKAILGNPPFPSMSHAYRDYPITEDEIFNLTAFLQMVDQRKDTQRNKDYGLMLLFYGLGGAVILLLLFGFLWTQTKRTSVNDEIFERQIKST